MQTEPQCALLRQSWESDMVHTTPANLTWLTLLDSPRSFPQLKPLTLRDEVRHRLPTNLSSFTDFRSSQFGGALASASAADALHVTVVGASTTMGCGSCEFQVAGFPELAGSERQHACPAMHTRRFCSPELSWVRQMEDALVDMWQNTGAPQYSLPAAPTTTVWARNAVGPGYFLTCPDTRLPSLSSSHIIIIELASNLFYGSIEALIRRLHESAPHAAIALMFWPPQDRAAQLKAHEALVAASTHVPGGADVYDIPAALDELQLSRRRFYAQGGLDNVHPNALGHFAIGALMARFVAASFRRVAPLAWQQSPRVNTTSTRVARASRAKLQWEVCYDHQFPQDRAFGSSSTAVEQREVRQRKAKGVQAAAATSPGQPSTSFSLVDEGAEKGVHKYGWASLQAGQKLNIGPIRGPPNRSCALLRVNLLYLASTVRRDQDHRVNHLWPGDLGLDCGGCLCISDQVPYHKSLKFPMTLRTDVNSDTDLGAGLKMNMSVTNALTFFALWRPESACWLNVTHRANEQMPRTNAIGSGMAVSKVRIDGLAIKDESMVPFAARMIAHPKQYPYGHQLVAKQLVKQTPCASEFFRLCGGSIAHDNKYKLANPKMRQLCELKTVNLTSLKFKGSSG